MGVILDHTYVDQVLQPEMEKLKRDFFEYHADEPVVFHRKDMVNYRGRFGVLKNPEIESAFNNALLKCFKHWEYSIITVLMDKKEHRDKYQIWKFDPYHYCLAVLMERYLFFLERHNAQGDVLIESRGTNPDMRLKKSFMQLMEVGSEFIKGEKFKQRLTSGEIKVKPKQANIAGLQLADLLAHPCRRDSLRRTGLYDSSGDKPRPFGEQIIEVITEKYERYKGEIMGSGIKKLP